MAGRSFELTSMRGFISGIFLAIAPICSFISFLVIGHFLLIFRWIASIWNSFLVCFSPDFMFFASMTLFPLKARRTGPFDVFFILYLAPGNGIVLALACR